MMKKVNIPRTVEDPEYRYKMVPLQQKIEGKGINVRTVLPNLRDVARDLRVPPNYILKFMGYELGSAVIERKQNNSIIAQINGQLNENDVLNALDKFIEKFVLCEKCRYPETHLLVDPSKGVIGHCNACSHDTIIDPKHKLTAYVKKNPPENRTEIQKKELVETTKIERKEKGSNASKYALRRLINASTDELDPYANADVFTAINDYLNDIMQIADDYVFDDDHVETIYKAIKRLRMNKEKYDKVGLILFNYIFNDKILADAKNKATLFEQVLIRHKLDEYVGHELIVNLAYFFYVRYADKDWTKTIPTILKIFHDEEIVDDEFLINWSQDKYLDFFLKHHLYKKENNERLKKDASVFINWLQPESEEDEDEEDEEED